MGWTEGLLDSGERIVYKAKMHWIEYFWLVIAVPYVYFYQMIFNEKQDGDLFSKVVLWFVIFLGIIYLRTMASFFILTDRRILFWALSFRFITKIPLSEVKGINVRQGEIGRKLGFGKILVYRHDMSMPAVFGPIREPEAIISCWVRLGHAKSKIGQLAQ